MEEVKKEYEMKLDEYARLLDMRQARIKVQPITIWVIWGFVTVVCDWLFWDCTGRKMEEYSQARINLWDIRIEFLLVLEHSPSKICVIKLFL